MVGVARPGTKTFRLPDLVARWNLLELRTELLRQAGVTSHQTWTDTVRIGGGLAEHQQVYGFEHRLMERFSPRRVPASGFGPEYAGSVRVGNRSAVAINAASVSRNDGLRSPS